MRKAPAAIRRVVIVGSGNLAEALARAVAASGLELVQIFSRNCARGSDIAAMATIDTVTRDISKRDTVTFDLATTHTSDPARLATADLYLLAVSDDALGVLAASLPFPEEAIVAHTAGGVPIDVLAALENRAVIYPLQTFTAGREVDFTQIPILLEASSGDLREPLETFARRLSHTVLWVDGKQRARAHLAAVFTCNFTNHMYVLGQNIIRQAELSPDIIKPLVVETAAKACAAASATDVQTGPAVRGDNGTMARHRAILAGEPFLQELYSTISESIWETSKKISH